MPGLTRYRHGRAFVLAIQCAPLAKVAARERGQRALLEAGLDFIERRAVTMLAHGHPQDRAQWITGTHAR